MCDVYSSEEITMINITQLFWTSWKYDDIRLISLSFIEISKAKSSTQATQVYKNMSSSLTFANKVISELFLSHESIQPSHQLITAYKCIT